MRFLIGIITGAAVTMLIATVLDAPTGQTLERAGARVDGAWDQLIETTSERLFTPDRQPESGSIEPVLPRPEAGDDLPPAPSGPSGLADATPAPAVPPAEPALNPIEPLADGSAPATNIAGTPTHEDPPPMTALISAANHREADDDDDQTPGHIAQAWEPFHSQMSARGFAARLSRELDHEFLVQRQGAGAYQVVFPVASVDEEAALLARIAEITGR